MWEQRQGLRPGPPTPEVTCESGGGCRAAGAGQSEMGARMHRAQWMSCCPVGSQGPRGGGQHRLLQPSSHRHPLRGLHPARYPLSSTPAASLGPVELAPLAPREGWPSVANTTYPGETRARLRRWAPAFALRCAKGLTEKPWPSKAARSIPPRVYPQWALPIPVPLPGAPSTPEVSFHERNGSNSRREGLWSCHPVHSPTFAGGLQKPVGARSSPGRRDSVTRPPLTSRDQS